MAYADYTRGTGSTGTMMTRVHDGSLVEFWLNSGQSATWFGNGTFSYSSPNGSGSWDHGYSSGNGWQLMGSINVYSSGNVTWTMPYTGTSGLGGPTSFTVYVQRATVPAAPKMIGVDQLTHQSFRVRFSGNSDGGSPIREWQVAYRQTKDNDPTFYTSSSGTSTIVTNWMPGTDVYCYARGRNDVGWGAWSGYGYGKLLPGIYVKVSGVWKNAIPYVKVGGVWMPAVMSIRVGGVWKETV